MPVVTVQMWTGRTPQQKRALARAITDAMVQHAGAKPTNLHVIIQEVPKEDWALAGVMGGASSEIRLNSTSMLPRNGSRTALAFSGRLNFLITLESTPKPASIGILCLVDAPSEMWSYCWNTYAFLKNQ